jgi:hypothetical protein
MPPIEPTAAIVNRRVAVPPRSAMKPHRGGVPAEIRRPEARTSPMVSPSRPTLAMTTGRYGKAMPWANMNSR